MTRTLLIASAFAAASAGLVLPPARAQGFETTDLRTVPVDTSSLEGGEWTTRANEPGRLTIACLDCEELTAIDVLLGEDADGVGQRYREGDLSIDALEAQCRASAPECTLDAMEHGRAVGWVTSYMTPMGAGATAVLFESGDKLTVRSIAPDAETARGNLDSLGAVLDRIIGG